MTVTVWHNCVVRPSTCHPPRSCATTAEPRSARLAARTRSIDDRRWRSQIRRQILGQLTEM
jgi:hypothetical protein